VLLVLLAACGDGPGAPGHSTGGSETPISSPTASAAPAKVLRFEAANLAGGVVRGADYAGKDVAIWFWAPW
jgi:hypothetical protein